MTTRRFPRTLNGAVPGHYPQSIERHRKSITERIADCLMAVVIGVSLAALLVHWATS